MAKETHIIGNHEVELRQCTPEVTEVWCDTHGHIIMAITPKHTVVYGETCFHGGSIQITINQLDGRKDCLGQTR